MAISEFEKQIHEMAAGMARNVAERGEGNTYEIPDTPIGKAIKRGYREGLEIRVNKIQQDLLRKAIANS